MAARLGLILIPVKATAAFPAARVFVVLLVELSAITPPVGINCFVVQASSNGRIELEDVFMSLIPYVLAGLFMLVLLCVFPQLALFLPGTMR